MKATTFIHALAVCKNAEIATQTIRLEGRADLVKVYGENGKVYAIGINGIPNSIYYYIYPEVAEQGEFYETLKAVCQTIEGHSNIADAIGTDPAGQLVITINILEA